MSSPKVAIAIEQTDWVQSCAIAPARCSLYDLR